MSDAELFIVAIALFGMGFGAGVLWALRPGRRIHKEPFDPIRFEIWPKDAPHVPKTDGTAPIPWPYFGHCAMGCGNWSEEGSLYCPRCREHYDLGRRLGDG